MLTEHAITFNESLTAKQLEYLAVKANRLGMIGREVLRVYTQEDGEGKHVYYETNGGRYTDFVA